MNELKSINTLESSNQQSKTSKFVENTKRAVRNVLIKTGIATSSMMPMATTTTPTVVPASVNTITAIAPLTSTAIKTISLGAAAELLASCSKDEPDGPNETKDIIAPTININKSEVDISGGKEIKISGNQLYIGGISVASWSDNKTKNCNVELSLNGKSISSGTTISEEGTLTIKVIDEAKNSKTADIKLNLTKNAPSITVNQYEVNIFGGVTVNINNNQLLFGEDVIASRNDDNLESCKVALKFNGKDIKSGDSINEAGKLIITITNKNEKSSTAEITVTNNSISGIENLKNASMQVDQEINLLNGLTFADGVELLKTEIEIDGEKTKISDPQHYKPEYPGTCNIIFTLKGKNGNTAEVKVDNLTIKPLDYRAIEVNNIKPVDILPIIGQVEMGDRNVYEHIEHLRIAEATRIRDMMWEYGAGNHSPEEYQKLMSRLNTGIAGETPYGYDNFEKIGERPNPPSYHAHDEWHILNTLIRHANFKVVDDRMTLYESLYDLAKNNENNINIFGKSTGKSNNRSDYLMDESTNNSLKKLTKLKNFILFGGGTNIDRPNNILKNKIYQEDINSDDEHGIYSRQSNANGKNDSNTDRHLIVTIGTDSEGDIDQTNETTGSSKYPVGFHDKILFAGRTFPYLSLVYNKIKGEAGKYPTSYPNYVNVAMASLCFQMFAEVKDVDELLEMIRSTGLTDYIRFDLNGDGDTNDNYNGQPESQPLILMNPAGFFQKYLTPTNLPNDLKSDKTTSLKKGYYKGVIFDIPGAEVKINGEWIAYNDANKSQIKSQNPMTLEWRLNGNLCKKLGYKGKSINGKIKVVDDKWNGLNMDKEFSINIQ